MQPFLIDTHCHVNFNAFKNDAAAVIQRAHKKNIFIINIGSQFNTSKRAVQMAASYKEGVYASIGLHPIHLFEMHIDEEETSFETREEKFISENYAKLIRLSRKNKIAAIGEIGLDYHHIPLDKSLSQIKRIEADALLAQLKFAEEHSLPVILHCRPSADGEFNAYDDLLAILKKSLPSAGGVIHCFSGPKSIADQFIKLGFYIGFTGIITFGKNAENLRNVVRHIPLEKILVETDSPYLAPDPYRGRRNEPSYVEYVAKKISSIKKVGYQKVAVITTANAHKLFKFGQK